MYKQCSEPRDEVTRRDTGLMGVVLELADQENFHTLIKRMMTMAVEELRTLKGVDFQLWISILNEWPIILKGVQIQTKYALGLGPIFQFALSKIAVTNVYAIYNRKISKQIAHLGALGLRALNDELLVSR